MASRGAAPGNNDPPRFWTVHPFPLEERGISWTHPGGGEALRSLRAIRAACITAVLAVGLITPPATAALPGDCGLAAYTPVQWKGELIAKGEANCETPRLMRVTVRLQRRVEGEWRNRAVATGTSDTAINSMLVRAIASCRKGPHRTSVDFRFRDDLAEPWRIGLLGFTSPPRVVRFCP